MTYKANDCGHEAWRDLTNAELASLRDVNSPHGDRVQEAFECVLCGLLALVLGGVEEPVFVGPDHPRAMKWERAAEPDCELETDPNAADPRDTELGERLICKKTGERYFKRILKRGVRGGYQGVEPPEWYQLVPAASRTKV